MLFPSEVITPYACTEHDRSRRLAQHRAMSRVMMYEDKALGRIAAVSEQWRLASAHRSHRPIGPVATPAVNSPVTVCGRYQRFEVAYSGTHLWFTLHLLYPYIAHRSSQATGFILTLDPGISNCIRPTIFMPQTIRKVVWFGGSRPSSSTPLAHLTFSDRFNCLVKHLSLPQRGTRP